MALVDSRLGPGTLTFGSSEYGIQITNVRLVPTIEETDGTPTLGDPKPDPTTEDPTWALEGSAIQDWEDDLGFVEYCRDNHGTTVTFSWVPASAAGVTYSGSCVVKAVEIGGDAGVQATTDFSFRVTGDITRVDA
jgi:hypothetical protein